MSIVTLLFLHLGAVEVRGVVLLFVAGIYAAAQVQQNLLPFELEPGTAWDPKILAALGKQVFVVERMDGTGKMRIRVPRISASPGKDAARQGFEAVRKLMPDNGYSVSVPEAVREELEPAGR